MWWCIPFSHTWDRRIPFFTSAGKFDPELVIYNTLLPYARRTTYKIYMRSASENLMVHYFSLMLELKFTEFVILKNKYNCWWYISGLYLCSGVICEVSWFRNRSGGFFKRKQKEVGVRKIIKRQFWVPDRKISVSGGIDQHPNLGWRLGWDLLINPTLDWYVSIWNSKWC